ncbi:hypothetical protein FBQ97_16320, partial [Acidobacteria bacterium ACD]|nr:hypothetical protein [Acidobacteria bacterium ACD]
KPAPPPGPPPPPPGRAPVPPTRVPAAPPQDIGIPEVHLEPLPPPPPRPAEPEAPPRKRIPPLAIAGAALVVVVIAVVVGIGQHRKSVRAREEAARQEALARQVEQRKALVAEASRLLLELLAWPKSLDRLFRTFRDDEGVSWAGKSGTMRGIRGDSGILTTRKGTFVLAAFVDGVDDDRGGGPRANTAMAEAAREVVESWSATLPDLPAPPAPSPWPEEPPPSTGRLGLTLAQARAGGVPELSRVFRPADRAFWELWEASGGSVADACLVPSPNGWWEENDPQKIDPVTSIVLHHTGSATDVRCVEKFLDPQSFVSAHFLVGTDGRLYQFVSLEHRAWHAGLSYLHGERALNRSSIGIEVTGDGNLAPFTQEQLATVRRLLGVLVALLDVKAPSIVGHQHVAPGRKPDPGIWFPWNDVLRDALDLAKALEPRACPARLAIGARPLGRPLGPAVSLPAPDAVIAP